MPRGVDHMPEARTRPAKGAHLSILRFQLQTPKGLPLWTYRDTPAGPTWHVARSEREAVCGARLDPMDPAFYVDEPASTRACSECLRRTRGD